MSKSLILVTTVVLLLSLSLVQCAEKENKDVKPKVEEPDVGQDNMNDMDVMGALSDCNETFRIDMSYLLALNESGSFPDETDRTPKCYVRCVLEMVDVASADGQFDPERAEDALMGIRGVRALSNVKEVAVTCSDRQETCKCERSYQFIKCLMEMEIKMAEKS
uniref:Odorant binding protein 15 n=1 Tax=Grapholita molesta TaxID=192188 RepID=A0A0M5J912_GRAMO|nr:odorant binding protein 15 [Grapholita molesta]